jgi:hypothetical protein
VIAFLSPLFLVGALAAAVPIVLHLFKHETEAHLRFSAVKFLRRAPAQESQRRRLRELLLLALRVAALCLLALAFARPFLQPRSAAAAGITIVALDTSMSMSAPGQFDRARRLAREAIDRAPGGDAVAVVSFADSSRVAAAPSGDRASARAAIDGASTGFGATDYRAALGAVSALLNGYAAARATVVVVTDLQESGWSAGDRGALPESAHVEIADIGAPPPNLAVTGVRVDGDRIVVTVRNADARGRDARVRLVVDGRPVADATAAVGPNQLVDVVLAGARGATAEVSVDDPMGIQGDNTRFVVLNNAGRPSVLMVTASGDLSREAFYAEQALLAAGADGAAYRVLGTAAAGLSAWDIQRLDEHAAVVLLSTRGLDRRGRDLLGAYVAKGGGLFVATGDEVDGETVAGVLGSPVSFALASPPAEQARSTARTLAPADLRHPIFRAFGAQAATLGLVKFTRFTRISGAGCQILAKFTSGEPALMDCAPDEGRLGRALVFASDLGNQGNDFPLHATFVPFLHEAIKYLGGGHPRQGEYLVGEAPPGVPSKPGVSTLPGDAGRQARSIAVNVDSNESDPRRLTPDEFQAAVGRLKDAGGAGVSVEARQEEDRQHVWQYLLAIMIVMLVAESFMARRLA